MPQNNFQTNYGIFATEQSRKIIADLTAAGKQFIQFQPAIIDPAPLFDGEQFERLNEFDWIVFYEPAGVEFFLSALKTKNIDLFELDNLRICALGEMTADSLRFEQLHTDIIFAGEQTKLTRLIEQYVADRATFETQKIIVAGETNKNTRLTGDFGGCKLNLTLLNIYESRIESQIGNSKLKALLKGGAIDQFVLTSPNDLISMRNYYPAIDENKANIGFEISAVDQRLVQFVADNGFTAKIFRQASL